MNAATWANIGMLAAFLFGGGGFLVALRPRLVMWNKIMEALSGSEEVRDLSGRVFVKGRAGLIDTLNTTAERVAVMEKELKHNGGSSMKDAVRRIEAGMDEFRATSLIARTDMIRISVILAQYPVVCVGKDGTISFTNRAAEDLVGWGPGALDGQRLDVLIPVRSRVAHHEYHEAYLQSPMQRHIAAGRNLAILRQDGTEVRCDIGLLPVGDYVLAYIHPHPDAVADA